MRERPITDVDRSDSAPAKGAEDTNDQSEKSEREFELRKTFAGIRRAQPEQLDGSLLFARMSLLTCIATDSVRFHLRGQDHFVRSGTKHSWHFV